MLFKTCLADIAYPEGSESHYKQQFKSVFLKKILFFVWRGHALINLNLQERELIFNTFLI